MQAAIPQKIRGRVRRSVATGRHNPTKVPGRNQALKVPLTEAIKTRQHNGPMRETMSRGGFTEMAMQFHKTQNGYGSGDCLGGSLGFWMVRFTKLFRVLDPERQALAEPLADSLFYFLSGVPLNS
jgi:hypothetical protein